jgi:hypothetical protein
MKKGRGVIIRFWLREDGTEQALLLGPDLFCARRLAIQYFFKSKR